MADSPAVRQRRSRLHRAGDHTLCDPKRCQPGDRPEASHDLTDATEAYLGGDHDALAIYAQVLAAAARAVDQAPTPGALAAYSRAFRVLRHAQHLPNVT